MTRYQHEIFLICSEIIYACGESSNSTTKTWYLFMDFITFLYIIYIHEVHTFKLITNVQEHTLILCHIMLPPKSFAGVSTFYSDRQRQLEDGIAVAPSLCH